MPREAKKWHTCTKRTVDAFAPDPTKTYDAYFVAPRGFHVRVFSDGRKTFALRYKDGPTYRRFTIGAYGVWTVQKAEARAFALRQQVDDPARSSPHLEKEHAKAAQTLRQVVAEYLLELDAEVAAGTKSKAHAVKFRAHLERRVPTWLGSKLVASVTVDDIRRVLKPYVAKRAQHNHLRSALSGVFTHAAKRRLITFHPVEAVDRQKLTAREPDPLDDAQCFALGEALRAYEADGKPWQAIAAIRLLFLTACRRSEVLRLTWSEVQWDLSALHLSKSKTLKQHGTRRSDRRTVGKPVLDLIRDIQRRHETEKIRSEYVLPSPQDPSRPYSAVQIHWERIRKTAGIPAMHLHDFRHDVLSDYGAEFTAAIGQAISGHATQQHLARYQRAQKDTKVTAAADAVTTKRQAALDTAPALKLVG